MRYIDLAACMARFKVLDELRLRRAPSATWNNLTRTIPLPIQASWADKHRGTMLRKCLGALSPEHRTIIDLVYYHEKSVQEVAAIVGISCATVKTPVSGTRASQPAALLAAERVTGAAPRSRVCRLCEVLHLMRRPLIRSSAVPELSISSHFARVLPKYFAGSPTLWSRCNRPISQA